MKPLTIDAAAAAARSRVGTVLRTAGLKLLDGAKMHTLAGAHAEANMLAKAAKIMISAAELPHDEFMDTAASIHRGIKFGTQAILEDFWADLVTNSLKLAANLIGEVLDLDLGQGLGQAPTSSKSKSKSKGGKK